MSLDSLSWSCVKRVTGRFSRIDSDGNFIRNESPVQGNKADTGAIANRNASRVVFFALQLLSDWSDKVVLWVACPDLVGTNRFVGLRGGLA